MAESEGPQPLHQLQPKETTELMMSLWLELCHVPVKLQTMFEVDACSLCCTPCWSGKEAQ